MADFGMNMALVGNRNRSTILNYINKMGSASRKEIAEATGLTAAAVTQISQGLIKEGVLVETGTLDGAGAGRKRVLLKIDYDCQYLLSVNIELTHTVIALCNMKGDAVGKAVIKTEKDMAPEDFLEKIAEECRKLTDDARRAVQKKLSAVCVGIPGIVDQENGTAIKAYGIWEDEVPVCGILNEKLSLPCYLANNVNAFALASSLYGIGRLYDNILVIKWGPGVGGTILIDNKVYDGRHGKAAELGHFIVRKNGRKCNCGRKGCLETIVSYNALNEVVSFEEGGFTKAYENAEESKRAVLDEYIELFARSIVNTVTVLAPDRVILCGFLFGEETMRTLLLERIKEFDPSINERRILYTELSDKEDYIGPVAAYVKMMLE